jgi:hypothetical protein
MTILIHTEVFWVVTRCSVSVDLVASIFTLKTEARTAMKTSSFISIILIDVPGNVSLAQIHAMPSIKWQL